MVTSTMHAATLATGGGGLGSGIATGVATGFAGSLSTVSTLYAEARVLNGWLMVQCE